VQQLHDNGYKFVGDDSFYQLTVREVRVLLEGMSAKNEQKAKSTGQTTGSGVHERPNGKPRKSDEEWVKELASKQ